MDHSRFEMEATVTEIEDEINILLFREMWRSAAENLAFAQRRNLWDEDVVTRFTELRRGAVKSCVELDSTHHSNRAAGPKVPLDRSEEMRDVDLYVHEDVQGLDLGDVDGYEAGMGVVHEHITAECAGSVVIYTTGTVGDITHDQRADARAELCEDV